MHGSRANTATTPFALVFQLQNFYLTGIFNEISTLRFNWMYIFLRYIDSVDNGELGKDGEI